jgi:hypothetical protein
MIENGKMVEKNGRFREAAKVKLEFKLRTLYVVAACLRAKQFDGAGQFLERLFVIRFDFN